MKREDLGEGAWVAYDPDFLPEHAEMMGRLAAALPLQAEMLTLFGRKHATPRLTSWHGDADAVYRYSGRTFEPHPWTEDLSQIRARVEASTGHRFNGVLANLYRDGRDSMGIHADDEKELGPGPDVLVASVSLGARRRFVLQHRETAARREWALGEGDLLVMGGTTQRWYRHHVPKTRRDVGPRLNLTFRILRG